ncbi:cupin domain-containing protein [Sphingomonas oligophenolica]|uniref:Cupin domain-containing protein n=1 Tax=Sphingomonas oligophenolica TaxID=301154 RepID=A0A502CKV4_9SPHN|nr:cupin domain-containing protein [Sphingomonas oligophenolica]TPG12749.1 cupin domain-containing protein [Sphingomonas oligophenolica]
MPKLDLDTIPQTNLTGYPPPFDAAVEGRWYRRLAPAAGLSCFGASHVTLKPGAWSSQRHWHAGEDELVVILAGEAVLVEDGGETIVRAGDIAAFPKGVRDGHHLQNRSDRDCIFVAIGAGEDDWGDYPDIDMRFTGDEYQHKDGTPYPTERIP